MPPNEATVMVASPEPQMAVTRRSEYVTTTAGFATMTGATAVPALGDLSFSGLSLTAGGCGLASGALLAGGAGGDVNGLQGLSRARRSRQND